MGFLLLHYGFFFLLYSKSDDLGYVFGGGISLLVAVVIIGFLSRQSFHLNAGGFVVQVKLSYSPY